MADVTNLGYEINSLHELEIKAGEFTIGDQPHIYKTKRMSADSDTILLYKSTEGFKNIGYITPHRKHSLKIQAKLSGLMFETVIKLAHIHPIKKSL